MSSFVDNLKINNLYYTNNDTNCKQLVLNIDKPNRTLIPLDKQNNPFKYDDSNFWNNYFDYNNKVNNKGEKVFYSGVCNPLLLSSCEYINKKDNVPMNGICYTKNLNKNKFYFNIDTDMNRENNYKNNIGIDFNINNSYKLNSNDKISDSIDNKENFAKKYCKTGEFIIKNNQYFCL